MERWYVTIVPVLIAFGTFMFSAGVYVGRDSVTADVRLLKERLEAHRMAPVHTDGARQSVMDRELALLRVELDRIEAMIRRVHP